MAQHCFYLDSDKTHLSGQTTHQKNPYEAGDNPKNNVGYSDPPHIGFSGHPAWQPMPDANAGNPSINRSREYDPEDPLGPEVKGFEFTDESIRRGFIRKVYSILSVRISLMRYHRRRNT